MKKFYLLLLCTVLSSPALFAQIFVTESGGGAKDGSSWANAYEGTKLQQAINEAELTTEKQVWVAKGTYKPTEYLSTTMWTTTARDVSAVNVPGDVSFILKAGVAIYGGFAGNEDSINDRILPDYFGDSNDPEKEIPPLPVNPNETILSGDLSNNNAAGTDDAFHVVSARDDADGAILDGFTIQHGYGTGNTYAELPGGSLIRRNTGAAIAFYSGKTLTFSNLVIKNNRTLNVGGAIHATAANADARFNFIKVRFENNTSTGTGGVMYATNEEGASQLNITDCIFLNNAGGGGTGGGAIYFAGASNDAILNVTNGRFENNQVTNTSGTTYGGAMRIGTGVANLTGVVVKGNKVEGSTNGYGGAIYSTGSATVNTHSCTFKDNTASTSGGHWYIFNGTVTVTNTLFEGGSSVGSGGVFFVASGVNKLDIFQSEFYNNTAEASAGVIYTTSNVNISKSRFYHNTATNHGGVFYIYTSATSDSHVKVSNSLFYNNTANGTGAANQGGAIAYMSRDAAGQKSTLTATNNTFYANKSPNSPHGAISFNGFADVSINLYNNIFNGNTGNNGSGDIRLAVSPTMDFRNNLFQVFNVTAGTNDTFADNELYDGAPTAVFASTDEFDGIDGSGKPKPNPLFLQLIEGLATEKGDDDLAEANGVLPGKDFAGEERKVHAKIDLGAYEYQGALTLPVQVSSFTANLANGRTQLKWSVGTEDNVNRYEVERSQNGTDFTTVTTLGANGAGSYSTTDNSPALGINYYRLVTIDNDGTRKAYDRVQTVTVATLASEGVSVYPNPAIGSEVNVGLGNVAVGTYTYKIVSTTGSVAQQGTLSYNGTSAVVSVGSLPAGVYVLQFSNGAQAKLIKQ